jgi:tetratricopeptide (TPR) repeat protein
MQPTSASDYFLLGAQEYRSDKFQQASSDFEAVLKLQPNYFGALYGSAMCDMNGGRWAGAKAYLNICIGRHPDLPQLYSLRAWTKGELREFEAAEADLQEAKRLSEAKGLSWDKLSRYSLHVHRGVVRLRQGKYDDASADFRTAITLKPGWYPAHLNLAQALRAQGDLCGALEQLDVAIKLEPTLASLYRERSRVHFEHHDDQAALADINQAIHHDPQGKPAEDDHAIRRRILQRMNAEPR